MTGGATGIGRATALAVARRGATVAINYRASRTEAEETRALAEAEGVRALAIQCDVADDRSVRAMVDRVVAELGGLHGLVCSAGTTRYVSYAELDGLTDDVWQGILQVNLMGTFYACRAALQHMAPRRLGAIVNIASTAAFSGIGSSIPYAVSKGAVVTLTKALDRGYTQHQVRVNAIAPGVVETRWIDGRTEFKEAALRQTPLGRVATPEDVATTAVYLLESDFVVGQTIILDGGRTIH
ncbi:MAG: SDR family oxidoreductase [Chloroflexi bacterium]|nr:SDR family oxidoreductase [Chloroflexota bacterium]